MSVKTNVFVFKKCLSICRLVVANIFLYVSNILCIVLHRLYHEILAKCIKQQEKLSTHIATINVITCKLMKAIVQVSDKATIRTLRTQCLIINPPPPPPFF